MADATTGGLKPVSIEDTTGRGVTITQTGERGARAASRGIGLGERAKRPPQLRQILFRVDVSPDGKEDPRHPEEIGRAHV